MDCLAGRALVVVRQPVVRDLLPVRRVRDELPVLRADARVAVEGAEANADHLGVVGVAAPELRAARGAELLGEAVSGRQARTRSSPETIRSAPGATRAWAEAAVPDLRWQRVQWQ